MDKFQIQIKKVFQLKINEIKKMMNRKDCKKDVKCTLCNIVCNTVEQFNIHVSSKSHMKKQEMKNISSNNTYFCQLCDKKFITSEQFDSHINDTSHKNKAEMNKPIGSGAVNKNEYNSLNKLLIPKIVGNVFTCLLCNMTMDTKEQYNVHCNGTKHQKKLKSTNVAELVTCFTCKISIDKNNIESHINGKNHKEILVKFASSELTDEIVSKTVLLPELKNIKSLKFEPAKYHMEVYETALQQDCVILMSTGIYEVATMLILKMLEENPHHRIGVLVNKGESMTAIFGFLKNQLENISLTRILSKNHPENRKLKFIGLANKKTNIEHLCSIRDHDIIISTADYFKNCLYKQEIYWTDFSLIIIEEAHHCVGEHPYNKLLIDNHLYPKHILANKSDFSKIDVKFPPAIVQSELETWKIKRCKIIALTNLSAEIPDSAFKSLGTLLHSLGDVNIVTISENVADSNRFDSFIQSVKHGSIEEFNKFYREEYLDKEFEGLSRAIHYACRYGRCEIIKMLISLNCKIEALDIENQSPLDIARKNKYPQVIDILLSTINGRKLLLASKEGDLQTAEILIKMTCDIEICDEKNRRPIHHACINGHFKIVDLLIKNNCDFQALDKDKTSPLDLSKQNHHQSIIEILNSAKCDHILKKQISSMGLICSDICDHKFCSKSFAEKSFSKGKLIRSYNSIEVYQCKASLIDREFAIKCIPLNNSEENNSRNIEENVNHYLEVLQDVRIVQYFGAIETDINLCIFMEFLSRGSLHDEIKRRKIISTRNVIRYSKQISEGLSYLHKKKIIHRDIKPANILLDEEDNIKLVDFGISLLLTRTDGHTTNTNSSIGTPYFMAPEVINGENYTFSADIWSLAATMINMISGNPPYHTLLDREAVIFKIGIFRTLELPTENISEPMKRLIKKMINPKPECRPSASELCSELSIINN